MKFYYQPNLYENSLRENDVFWNYQKRFKICCFNDIIHSFIQGGDKNDLLESLDCIMCDIINASEPTSSLPEGWEAFNNLINIFWLRFKQTNPFNEQNIYDFLLGESMQSFFEAYKNSYNFSRIKTEGEQIVQIIEGLMDYIDADLYE